MKRLEYIFIMFAAILLTTSCSKDDLLPDGSTDAPVTGQTQTYTFTVSPDIAMKGDARTRTAGTPKEMPTRCFMQIFGNNVNLDVQPSESIENGSFTFSVALPSNTDYTFLFWADNNSGDTPADLRAVQYTPGTVAFAANVQGTLETVDKTVELKHVVAKVTLKTTTNVTSEYSKNISLTASCASMYNVQEASASSFEDKRVSIEMTDAGFAANSEVLTTYIIPNPENKTVTLGAHEMTQAISNVPLAANTRVTLQGDLSESSSKWGNPTSAYIETKFQSYFFNENDQPKGYNNGYDDNYYIDNATNESVIALFKEITRSNSFQLPGAASEVKITNNLSIMPMYSNDIYIFYKNITFIVYLQDLDQRYPDFPSIYPGTNIN